MIELLAIWNIASAQVHVSELRSGWHRRIVQCFVTALDFFEKILEINRVEGHLNTIFDPLPLAAWAIPIQFEAIFIWIGQVECLADQVIRIAKWVMDRRNLRHFDREGMTIRQQD